MSSYGRNFEWRVHPVGGQKAARFVTPSTGDPIPIGAPIEIDTAAGIDELGRQTVALATGATAFETGKHGILVYEYKGAEGWAGDDQFLTTYSDKDTAPLGASCMMVSGDTIKVAFKNTEDRVFLNTRSYAGRVMVAGMGATPTVAVGDYLTPGTGDDDNGYWAEDATAANGWLVVTFVDTTTGLVEARMRF